VRKVEASDGEGDDEMQEQEMIETARMLKES